MSTITFEYVDAAVPPEEYTGPNGYDNGATYACKVILGIARRDPIGFKAALDAYRENPYGSEINALMTPAERAILESYGLTGFQWGWAVRTAAWLLEQPSVPNGAIITLRDGTS